MDLLENLGSSSDSDTTSVKSNQAQQQRQVSKKRNSSDSQVLGKKKVKKRKLGGTVSIVSSSQAPSNIFIRTTPHRRGHWAGHVLVPVKSFPRRSIQRSVSKFVTKLATAGHSGVVVQHDALHVSLSREFSLQAGNLEPFVETLTKLVSMEEWTSLFVDSQNEVLLRNEEGTRTFWCWNVQPNASLRRLVANVDNVLAQYNQPSYYEKPKFHISLASFPGSVQDFEQSEEDNSSSSDKSSDGSSDGDDDEKEGHLDHIVVDQIHCKFGTNKTFAIKLRRNR